RRLPTPVLSTRGLLRSLGHPSPVGPTPKRPSAGEAGAGRRGAQRPRHLPLLALRGRGEAQDAEGIPPAGPSARSERRILRGGSAGREQRSSTGAEGGSTIASRIDHRPTDGAPTRQKGGASR